MLVRDITRIVRVLLATSDAVASQDELTQRRIDQIGEVLGAVDDVTKVEEKENATMAEKRIDEAHDIIHRVATILAMEDGEEESETSAERSDAVGGGPGVARETVVSYGIETETIAENGAGFGDGGGELPRIAWDGKMDESMILLLMDENEDDGEDE